MFITTPEFLPQHHQQRQRVLQIITAAEARGQQRLVEMNQQVLGNLDRIITSLDQDGDDTEVLTSAFRGRFGLSSETCLGEDSAEDQCGYCSALSRLRSRISSFAEVAGVQVGQASLKW
jgi:hypothetical protein